MLTKRLNMIIAHINGSTVADIGTDHAYIPVQLAIAGKAEKIIATDVNKGPLSAAENNVKANNCEDKVELRLGNGLAPVSEGECDTIVIAGMGGELIVTILTEGEAVAKSADMLLLQPMNSQDLLREFLSKNGYEIIDEDITTEGFKVYNLVIAKAGKGFDYKDEFDLHLPEYLYNHEKFPKLLAKKKREFEKILTGLKKAKEKDLAEIDRYKKLLERVLELEG
ncbi:MAG: class I SAM-dependent methyltransferase [Clostridia bacterium]|nr:class I SAM-dependent methyltransferase [Clostridia bacterium]